MKVLLGFTLIVALSGCIDFVGRDMEMERAATNFSKAADDCLVDVSEKNIPYASSANCTKRLSGTSSAYTSFPSMQLTYSGAPVPRHAYIAESAKSVAWSAAALSNARFRNIEPILSLW